MIIPFYADFVALEYLGEVYSDSSITTEHTNRICKEEFMSKLRQMSPIIGNARIGTNYNKKLRSVIVEVRELTPI